MENQQQATIKDIANKAGVSIATVDRVLHNRGRVSSATKESVHSAIEQLNYKPNQIARALSNRKGSIKIGLALPNVEGEFWGEILAGVQTAQDYLAPFGVELVSDYSFSYDLDAQIESIGRLLKNNIQGLIVTPMYDGFGNLLSTHIPRELPYGTIINDLPGPNRLFHIGPDDFGIGKLAARLTDLYCSGKGDVVILAPNHSMVETQNRISGFVSKINQDHLGISVIRIVPVPGKIEKEMYDEIYQCTLTCLEENPDIGAFYVTNGLIDWCAEAVTAKGMAGKVTLIGHEVTRKTVVGLQNRTIQPTIYQHPAQQIYTSINLMFEYLTGKEDNIVQDNISTCSIIVRENLNFSDIKGFIDDVNP